MVCVSCEGQLRRSQVQRGGGSITGMLICSIQYRARGRGRERGIPCYQSGEGGGTGNGGALLLHG
eukprot:362425-Chlamydomonas_euryale.AAC.7